MELKFSGSISNVKVKVHAKFCEVLMSVSYISKTAFLQIVVCKLQMTLFLRARIADIFVSGKEPFCCYQHFSWTLLRIVIKELNRYL